MSKTTQLRLLLLGPLPPPLGGATVLFKLLVDELEMIDKLDLQLINTVKEDCGIFSRIQQLVQLVRGFPRAHVVTLHASTSQLILFGGILSLLCRFFRKPFIARAFGGSLYEVGSKLPGVKSYFFKSLLKSDLLLVEIKKVCQNLKKFCPSAQVEWFPNSREFNQNSLFLAIGKKNCLSALKVGFVSHIRQEKGVYEIGEAIAQVAGDVEVVLHGPVFEEVDMGRVLTDFRMSYGGELESKDVSQFMASCDVIILPSWYEGEGYPGTLIESFGVGVPVIASRWKYIPEVVEDGVNGLLVEPKSSESLRAAIQQLVDDPSMVKSLAEGALKSAENYSSKKWNREKFVQYVYQVSYP